MSSKHLTTISLVTVRPLTEAELQDTLCTLGPCVRQAYVRQSPLLNMPEGEKLLDRAQDGVPEPTVEDDAISRIELPPEVTIPPIKVDLTEP